MRSERDMKTVEELGVTASASLATTGAVTVGVNIVLQSSLNQILGQL